MSNTCVTNPVSSTRVVDISIDWKNITPPDCLSLNDSLQTIVTELDTHLNQQYVLNCLTPATNDTVPEGLTHVIAADDGIFNALA